MIDDAIDELAAAVNVLARHLDVGAIHFDYDLSDGSTLALGFDADRPDEMNVLLNGQLRIWRSSAGQS
jgi:hypothetical protein